MIEPSPANAAAIRVKPPRLVVLDAPSNLGLRPPSPGVAPGVGGMPAALRRHGLVGRIGARDGGVVPAPAYDFGLDAAVGVRNWQAIAAYATTLADAIAPPLAAGERPVVLGGDCSIALGVQLALRRRGDYGLVYVDGHDDLQTPAVSRTGGAAGMDVAMMLGHGPAALSDLEGRGPLLRPAALALLGMRGGWVDDPVMTALRETRIGFARDLVALRTAGLRESAAAALARLTAAGVAGVWLHLDADVIDSTLMPAVDSPQPGGLTYDELAALADPLLASPLLAGISVTIYDPDRDPTGDVGRRFTDALVAMLNGT